MMTLEFWEIPLACSIIANVWIHLLSKPGKVFEFAEYYFKKVSTNKKLGTVLFDCSACLSGQLSLISIFYLCFFDYGIDSPILTIFASIYLSALLSKLLTYDRT